jgi:hypothetical protein
LHLALSDRQVHPFGLISSRASEAPSGQGSPAIQILGESEGLERSAGAARWDAPSVPARNKTSPPAMRISEKTARDSKVQSILYLTLRISDV